MSGNNYLDAEYRYQSVIPKLYEEYEKQSAGENCTHAKRMTDTHILNILMQQDTRNNSQACSKRAGEEAKYHTEELSAAVGNKLKASLISGGQIVTSILALDPKLEKAAQVATTSFNVFGKMDDNATNQDTTTIRYNQQKIERELQGNITSADMENQRIPSSMQKAEAAEQEQAGAKKEVLK